MTKKMKAAQISKPGADFELVERDIPEPGAGQVRMKVEACGICHSDVLVKEGLWPGIQYPRVPGHEVAGRIDAIGPVRRVGRAGSPDPGRARVDDVPEHARAAAELARAGAVDLVGAITAQEVDAIGGGGTIPGIDRALLRGG